MGAIPAITGKNLSPFNVVAFIVLILTFQFYMFNIYKEKQCTLSLDDINNMEREKRTNQNNPPFIDEMDTKFHNRKQLGVTVSAPQSQNLLMEKINSGVAPPAPQHRLSLKFSSAQSGAERSEEFVSIESLITKFAPVFHLHPREEYLPCSVEWFLQRAELIDTKTQDILIQNGFTTPLNLHQVTLQNQTSKMELRIQKEDRCGMHVNEIDQNAPIYVHVKEVVNQHDDIEAIEINYITFYAYNGEYKVMGVSALAVGHHEGDWEHVTVRCDPQKGFLLGVWYNAHRSREGSWKLADQVVVDPVSGRLSVYVALHGHGTYPEAGTFHRLFYVANDRTSCKGITWIPQKFILMQPHPKPPTSKIGERGILQVKSRGCSVGREILNNISANHNDKDFLNKRMQFFQIELIRDPCEWQKFEGLWGTVPGPSQQDWYHTAEQPVSRGYVKRVFLPLSAEVEHTQNSTL